jgi:hypothetical protein
MKNCTFNNSQRDANGFDLFRLSKSKEVVDVCSNTLRAYFKQGLPYYKRGKAIFVSKAEFIEFIRNGISLIQKNKSHSAPYLNV